MGLSYRFRDFRLSVENHTFSHDRVINVPAEGVPLESGTNARGQKMMGYTRYRAEKKFYDIFRYLDKISGSINSVIGNDSYQMLIESRGLSTVFW